MIPKIICWLFGHVFREKSYQDVKEGVVQNVYTYRWRYWKICPRCGQKIDNPIGGE